MTHSQIKTFAFSVCLALAALSPILTVSNAEAGGKGKEYFQQTYRLDKPLHGVEGQFGDHYCSYQRVPVHKIDANGRMKVVAWELRQHCY